jgi:hypothetical protein
VLERGTDITIGGSFAVTLGGSSPIFYPPPFARVNLSVHIYVYEGENLIFEMPPTATTDSRGFFDSDPLSNLPTDTLGGFQQANMINFSHSALGSDCWNG